MKHVAAVPGNTQQWNNTEKPYHLECIHDIFARQTGLTPDHIALVFGDHNVTYRELNSRANRLARYLNTSGAEPGCMIGIYVERSIELVISVLAILKAGCAYVPLATEYPPERIKYLIADCDLHHIITGRSLVSGLILDKKALKIILPDDAAIFDQKENDRPLPVRTSIYDPVYVIYTSGSTGNPKGVLIEHAGICNRLLWMQDRYRFTADDAFLFKAPIGFDVSVYEIFFPILNGARVVIVKPGGQKNIKHLIKVMTREKVTMSVFIPPAMLDVFLETIKTTECTTLRTIICGGEKWSFSLGEKCLAHLDARLYNGYGPTEAAVGVTTFQFDPHYDKKVVPLGRPITNVKAYILDEDLKQVSVDETGELCISGICLARGYINNPELTALKFRRNPFAGAGQKEYARMYMSGDLAKGLDDGCIEFYGRKDNQVKVGGVRIEPGEIESILLQHPGIIEAVVLCKVLPDDNKILAAFIVPRNKDAVDAATVRDYLSIRVSEAMIPAIIKIAADLPLTENNKVDKNKLLTMLSLKEDEPRR
ncbi:MAG TPA: amino acid adenylation domain-containing protein [Candidatus Deferrimicrobium sp.]|nr:amino acid adenylation domain-containing protein [Candidatus Deferrimicrobium sp.]